jgi:hypothetical protein
MPRITPAWSPQPRTFFSAIGTSGSQSWWIQNRDPDHDDLIAIIQPDESGLDALPAYDTLLHMPTVDPAGLRQAMERIFAAYAPLRHTLPRLMAANVFHVEDVMMNSIYAQGLRSLARLCRVARELEDAGEFEQYAEFWLPYPVPSVAASEPTFDPEAKTGLLWRGSTWVNMNWFLVGGLQQYGYYELAHELAVRTCSMVIHGGFREYFSPYTGQGHGAPDFGWTTLILDLLTSICAREPPARQPATLHTESSSAKLP